MALEPVYQVAFLLTLVAAFWPAQVSASSAPGLAVVSLTYGAAAFLLAQRAWAYASVGLLPVVFAFALRHLGVAGEALPLAWALLAAALLAGAEVAARRSGEARRPLLETTLGLGAWRSRFASPLFSAGYAVGLLALGLALGRYWIAPTLPGARDLDLRTTAALLIVVAACALAAAARRTSLFLYPATWIFLIPFTAGSAQALLRLGLGLTEQEMARLLAVLGAAYLAVALVVDRAGGHYAKPVYLVGYTLTVATMLLSALDRATNVQVVGLSLLAYAGSAWLVHRGRHPSYLWLARRLCGEAGAAHSVARSLFLYLASWLFPVWLMLAISLWSPPPAVAHYGLALALLAPLYVWLGTRFRQVAREYRLPWYLAGYALSALGTLVATPDAELRALALGLAIALYAASAAAFRQSPWLYPVALLTPVLALLMLDLGRLGHRFYGLAMIDLALIYGLVALVLHQGPGGSGGTLALPVAPSPGGEGRGEGEARDRRREPAPTGMEGRGEEEGDAPRSTHARPHEPVGRYALPFLVVGYVLSALGLGHAANQDRWMVVVAFLLGAAYYAASAVHLRQSLFGYPVAWTAAVAYIVGMGMLPLEPRLHGLGLLPGIAAYLAVAEVLRRNLDTLPAPRSPLPAPRSPAWWLDSWSAPFYTVLYTGTVATVVYSWGDNTVWALAWWAVAAVYGLSTVLFRRPTWLYPTVGCTLGAYAATLRLLSTTPTFANAMAALAVFVWGAAWLAYAVAALRPASSGTSPWPALGAGRVGVHPWARPLLVWATLVLAFSAAVSLPDAQAGFRTALAYASLLAILATLWRGQAEAWAALVFAGLALQQGMRLAGLPLLEQSPRWALVAFALSLLAIGAARARRPSLLVWRVPLGLAGVGAAFGAAALALVLHGVQLSRPSLQALAFTTAVTGLTLVANGSDRGRRLWVYLGVALVEAGYMLQLLYFDVGQPQAFALPAGLYLLAVGYLEWRRGVLRAKRALEMGGLALLLGVSLIQAVGFLGDGHDRYLYDSLLFAESLAIFGLGAMLRWRRTFFAAIFALVADVLILLSDPIRAMNTWYLVAIAGFTMIGLVIFIEQKRREIPLWIEDWRARLEAWD